MHPFTFLGKTITLYRYGVPAGLIGLAILGSTLRAENEFSLQWKSEDLSTPLARLVAGQQLMILGLPEGSALVDASTTPPNPFKEREASLHVVASNPESVWFRLAGRPMVDLPPKQGWIEFEFRIVSGTISVIAGSCSTPWTAGNSDGFDIADPQVAAVFSPGKPVMIRGREFRGDSIDVIEENRDYTFLIKWDFSGNPTAPFAVYLNGERLTSPAERAAFVLPKDEAEAGINAFRVALGNSADHVGEFFLGHVASEGGPVELDKPEKP